MWYTMGFSTFLHLPTKCNQVLGKDNPTDGFVFAWGGLTQSPKTLGKLQSKGVDEEAEEKLHFQLHQCLGWAQTCPTVIKRKAFTDSSGPSPQDIRHAVKWGVSGSKNIFRITGAIAWVSLYRQNLQFICVSYLSARSKLFQSSLDPRKWWIQRYSFADSPWYPK